MTQRSKGPARGGEHRHARHDHALASETFPLTAERGIRQAQLSHLLLLPELVEFEENGVDARSVDYSRLTAVLIEAVKTQQQ